MMLYWVTVLFFLRFFFFALLFRLVHSKRIYKYPSDAGINFLNACSTGKNYVVQGRVRRVVDTFQEAESLHIN